MSLFSFSINMAQFKSKVRIYADNCDACNVIEWTKGSFQTVDPQQYIDLLNEYCIFYTLKVSSPRDGGWYPPESFNA